MGANYTPEWKCETGYSKGHDGNVKKPGADAIIKEYKSTSFYKIGYTIGIDIISPESVTIVCTMSAISLSMCTFD